jgi:single-stranded-DNA-specific exonuclease
LADAIRAHPELVVGGGHAMAAGFSTTAAQIPDVAKAFELYASTRLCAADFELTLCVEAEVEPSEVTFATVSALEAIEPYGNANEEPMFAIGGVSVARVEQTKSPDHPRLVIRPSDGPVMKKALKLPC